MSEAVLEQPHALDAVHQPLTICGMEVHFTPEQEAQLSRIATHAGMDAERLVKDAALRFVEEKNRFSAAIREGIAQADRGELIDDDEVRVWLEQQERS
jgi:predicted transcriptional regulator